MRIEAIVRQLIAELPASDQRKSSHWQHYTAGRAILADGRIDGIGGFGGKARRSPLHQAVHGVLQRRVLGVSHPAFRSPAHAAAVAYTRAQGRALDMDVLRHVCTMDLLQEHHRRMGAPNTVAVIGDGQANFVAAALASERYDTVVSINLVDVLLNDLPLLAALPGLTDTAIQVAMDAEEVRAALAAPQVKVVLVPANRAAALRDVGFDLVVNIASFQEMTPQIVDEYFALIRANRAWHYNCNRLHKVLPGGEVLDYLSWDWSQAEVVLDGLCPWHQHWYTYRPPFIRPYDGPIQHRLAKF